MTVRFNDSADAYGVVVGWEHTDLGGRLVLTLQSTRDKEGEEVDRFRYFLTNNQALLLGNYLCKASQHTLPKKPRRGLFGLARGD